MKTSKITAATFDKTFASKFGTMYQHTITLENGDSGQISAKEELPGWMRKGSELTYEITTNGKYPDKIKRVNQKFASPQNESSTYGNVEIIKLTARVEKLEQVIKSLVQANKLIYIDKPAKPQPVDDSGLPDNMDDEPLPF